MAPALDPNWFYSSLAQSAASFVGLFGGILAASVQAQHEPAAAQRERATAALRILNAQEVRFEDFYNPFNVVPDNKGGQGCSQAVIDVEEERLAVTSVLVPLLDRALTAKSCSDIRTFAKGMAPFTQTPANGMGGIVSKLVEDAERAAFEVESLELRTRTGTWGVLLVALAVVVLTGLVAPLP